MQQDELDRKAFDLLPGGTSAGSGADARFEAVVESCPSGMMMTDGAGRILMVNREIERLFGYDRAELIGRPVEDLIPERFRDEHPGHRNAFFKAPATRRMGAARDLYGLRADGTEVPIEIGLTPVRTDVGLCVLSSVVDITERREAEMRLRQAQKLEALGTLAGGIAHDFNNILLAIVGHAELVLADGDNLSQDQREDLESVRRATDRGRLLVERLLTLGRQTNVVPTPVDLRRAVDEALQLLRASLPSTVEIRTNLDASTPRVLSDETQIHQVIMNLATNAAHAMPGGGSLEVQLSPYSHDPSDQAVRVGDVPDLEPGLYARLSVRDSGCGMDEEIVSRVWEPFFTTKPPGQGSGLGLSVIHGIVKTHRGEVQLHTQPGLGTRVDIYLPACVDGPHQRSIAPEDAGKPHILLVDDEETLARMMTRQLRVLGYRVTTQCSSLEALATFRSNPAAFDLLLTDNTMPKMTGVELAEKIKALRPELPVLLVSGLAVTIDQDLARRSGISAVLPKPHSMAQLNEAVRTAIADSPALPKTRAVAG